MAAGDGRALEAETGMTTENRAAALVPRWLSHLAAVGWRVLVTVGLGIALLAIGLKLSTTIASLLVGGIAAATLSPFASRLRSRGWSGLRAAAAVTGALVLGGLGVLVLIFAALVPSITELADMVSSGLAAFRAAVAETPLGQQFADLLDRLNSAVTTYLAGQAAGIASTVATIATIVMLALFMTFFLLLDGDKAADMTLSQVSEWRRQRLMSAGQDVIEQVGGYIRGTVATAIIKAAAVFGILLLVGVPFAGPLTVITFFAGLVPYLGAFITVTIVTLVAFGQGGAQTGLLVFGLIVALLLVLKYLEPRLYGRTADIHPAVVLIALPIGATLGGLLGMIIAVPTIVFVSAILGPVLDVLGEPGERDHEATDADIPLWLERLAQWSWRGLVALALGSLFVAVAATVPLIVGPIVVAITLAATVIPAQRALERRGMTRTQASLIVALVLWVSILVVTVISVGALATQAADATDTATAIPAQGPSAESAVRAIVNAYQSGLFGTIVGVIGQLLAFAFFLALTALLSFYFLKEGDRAWDWATAKLSDWRRHEVRIAGTRAVKVLGGYMIATGVLGGFNAITGFVIMVLLGLPLALPIAVLSFLGGFIPYIGQAVTSLLAFLVALKFGTTQDVIIMGLYTIVMNVVQGSFIAPLVYGRAVSIHPAVVLLAIPAGGELAGVLGMFLAVPLLGVFAAVWRNLLVALGDRPSATTEAATEPDPAPAASPGVAVPVPET
jgi:predicted PurR-regulated permease PerM